MRIKKLIKTLALGGVLMIVLLAPSQAESFVYQDRVSMTKSLAHYAMGQIYDLLGQENRAVLEYEKAVQFDEGSYLVHLRLGTDYARLDMLSNAKKELLLAQRYNPEDLQAHYLLALIYSTEKEYDKAAAEYEIILKAFSDADPDNIEIYGYLGQLYYSQKKYKQAISQFEKILILEPKNADVMYLLGSLYLEVDNSKSAMQHLKNSIVIDPDHDGSLNTLAYLYAEEKQNLDEAEKLVGRALKISPDNGAYLDSLGWVYYQKGKYKKALDVLRKADDSLSDPVIYDHLGDVYLKLNQVENALKYWGLSLELLPNQKKILKKVNEIKNFQASR